MLFRSIFGYFITFSNMIVTFNTATNYFMQLVLLFISIVFIAIGVTMYLTSDLIPMPAEGVMLAIQKKKPKLQFHNIKTTFDVSVVIIAAVISLIVLGRLIGVREGTLIAAYGVGKMMGLIKTRCTWFVDFLRKFMLMDEVKEKEVEDVETVEVVEDTILS